MPPQCLQRPSLGRSHLGRPPGPPRMARPPSPRSCLDFAEWKQWQQRQHAADVAATGGLACLKLAAAALPPITECKEKK